MAAAAVARGDYFCVLDSDDEVMPEFTATVLDYPRRAILPWTRWGATPTWCVDGDERPSRRSYLQSIGCRPPAQGGEVLTVEDVLGGRVPYYTGAIRKEAWRAVGGYEPGVESRRVVLIWLRLAGDFEVRLLPDKLGRYRVRDQSLSRHPDKVEEFESLADPHVRDVRGGVRRPAPPRRIAQAPVRRLRYHQALRRARWAFVDGDLEAARRFARDARAQRATLRAAAIVGAAAGCRRGCSPASTRSSSGWRDGSTSRAAAHPRLGISPACARSSGLGPGWTPSRRQLRQGQRGGVGP